MPSNGINRNQLTKDRLLSCNRVWIFVCSTDFVFSTVFRLYVMDRDRLLRKIMKRCIFNVSGNRTCSFNPSSCSLFYCLFLIWLPTPFFSYLSVALCSTLTLFLSSYFSLYRCPSHKFNYRRTFVLAKLRLSSRSSKEKQCNIC